MTSVDATCWSLIHAAAAGDPLARDRFARLYQPVARSYIASRWMGTALLPKLDDAVQDAFVECYKVNGVLNKAVEIPPEGFRAFFHGVLRNVARRYEERQRPAVPLPDDQPSDDTSLSRAFDKAGAKSLLKEAARVQAQAAAQSGERAIRRVELLRLRFQEGLPIREIAGKWNEDAAHLHHEFATARDEFRVALRKVMAFHMPTANDHQLETACRDVIDLLK